VVGEDRERDTHRTFVARQEGRRPLATQKLCCGAQRVHADVHA